MKKPFAVFDIDGTLIRWQLYHAIANTIAKQGLIDPEVYKAVRQARMVWKRRAHEESFQDYEHQLVVAYNQTVSKLTVKQFEAAVQTVFEEYKDQVYTYTRDLIRDLKKRGYLLFAISGSQLEIVAKLAKYYGFDDWEGTVFERKGQTFTGKLTLASRDKHLVVEKLVKKHGASYKGSYGVGDTDKDISMLEMVEHPVAFNPTKTLFQYAAKKSWPVVVERKNMVYELTLKNGEYILI